MALISIAAALPVCGLLRHTVQLAGAHDDFASHVTYWHTEMMRMRLERPWASLLGHAQKEQQDIQQQILLLGGLHNMTQAQVDKFQLLSSQADGRLGVLHDIARLYPHRKALVAMLAEVQNDHLKRCHAITQAMNALPFWATLWDASQREAYKAKLAELNKVFHTFVGEFLSAMRHSAYPEQAAFTAKDLALTRLAALST